MPSSTPVTGWTSGTPTQVKDLSRSAKCSSPLTATGRRSSTAVPNPFVPARDSSYSTPGSALTRSSPFDSELMPRRRSTMRASASARITHVLVSSSSAARRSSTGCAARTSRLWRSKSS